MLVKYGLYAMKHWNFGDLTGNKIVFDIISDNPIAKMKLEG